MHEVVWQSQLWPTTGSRSTAPKAEREHILIHGQKHHTESSVTATRICVTELWGQKVISRRQKAISRRQKVFSRRQEVISRRQEVISHRHELQCYVISRRHRWLPVFSSMPPHCSSRRLLLSLATRQPLTHGHKACASVGRQSPPPKKT